MFLFSVCLISSPKEFQNSELTLTVNEAQLRILRSHERATLTAITFPFGQICAIYPAPPNYTEREAMIREVRGQS